MNQPSAEYFDQMREHARHAQALVQGLERDDFLNDRRTYQAVLMSLLIVGEAATQIIERHPDLASRFPDVPWRSVRGMRNRIAHDYSSIDLGIVWETVQQALPKLLVALDQPSRGRS